MHLIGDRCNVKGNVCVISKYQGKRKEHNNDCSQFSPLAKRRKVKDLVNSQNKYIPKEGKSIVHSHKSTASPDERESETTETQLKDVEGQMMLDALNGFVIFINKKHNIRFISASVADHLGLTVESLIGKNVHEIIHPCDIAELAKQFSPEGSQDQKTKGKAITDKSCQLSIEDKSQKVFYLRMKYNMGKSGSKSKQSGFTLVQWSGKLKQHISTKTGILVTDGLVCICRPMQTSSVTEIRMDGNMFMSRHNLGMTFTFCDTRILTLIGYEPNELLGKTAYHFHNPIDAPKVSACHQNLMIKGTSVSKYYRFLGKNDNWVWLQTRATIIYNTASTPQYIVCMNYVISEEEGERYLMLEEHKHANIKDDNAVVTLPDNHHPTLIFHREVKSTSGPTIIELEEKNLTKTACLNGALLDNPSNLPRPKSDDQKMPEKFLHIPDYPKHQQNGFYTEGDNIKTRMEPVFSEINHRNLPSKQSLPKHIENFKGRNGDSLQVHNKDSLCNTMPPNQKILAINEIPPKGLAGDTAGLENTLNNFFQASCHSNSSYTEDCGYESEASPVSSNRSPQVASPYGSDIGAEREYNIEMVSDQGAMTTIDPCNPAIIKNCDFGVGYSVDYDQINNMQMLDEKSPDIPDTDNILDEILKSFNKPSCSLDENMAVVFSTIENLTHQNYQTVTSTVKSPIILTENKKVLANGHPKSDKSFLRHILTIPENKIPKQPVSIPECDTKAAKLQPVCKENKRIPNTSISGATSTHSMTSGERLVNSMIQKSLMQRAKGEQIGGQSSPCKSQGQNTQLPDDISDFALQYMETDEINGDSRTDFSDISNDVLMDTSECDLTKDLLSELEHQCQSQLNDVQVNSMPISKNGQFQYNLGGNRNLKDSFSGFQPSTVNVSCHGNTATSSHDHLYVQSDSRSHHLSNNTSVMCNRTCVKGLLSYKDSQTQTSKPISELEKHLRGTDQTDFVVAVGENRSPNGKSSSLLQKLLTGELSKDSYIRMEQNRVPRWPGLKPN